MMKKKLTLVSLRKLLFVGFIATDCMDDGVFER
jgi:hypothetical protein